MVEINPEDEELRGHGNLRMVADAINAKPWAGDEHSPHPVLLADDLVAVLERYCSGAVSADDVKVWADAIEGRTDLVDYEDSQSRSIATVLFELASPAINGELTPEKANDLIALLGAASGGQDTRTASIL